MIAPSQPVDVVPASEAVPTPKATTHAPPANNEPALTEAIPASFLTLVAHPTLGMILDKFAALFVAQRDDFVCARNAVDTEKFWPETVQDKSLMAFTDVSYHRAAKSAGVSLPVLQFVPLCIKHGLLMPACNPPESPADYQHSKVGLEDEFYLFTWDVTRQLLARPAPSQPATEPSS